MPSNHIAVGGIDFGTAYSGWAISFRAEYNDDPSKVYARNWSSSEHLSPKTPTTILIKPDGKTFEAFGYQAENAYIKLAQKKEHLKYYYFKRFKMLLYQEQDIRLDTKLEAENGKSLPAMLVFQLAIQYLKDDLLSECNNRLDTELLPSDIHWAITVPAIWTEKAKQFMRQAAVKAGIKGNNLTIVLEPEAAAVYCQYIPLHKSVGGSVITLEPGTKYAVIDCGGGTVDICCHEVTEGKSMKEITKASGAALGGTRIDEAFEMMLIRLFGGPLWKKFRKECGDDFVSLFRLLEVKKREHSPTDDISVTIPLPLQLVQMFETNSEEKLPEAISQSAFHTGMKMAPGNKLVIDQVLVQRELYTKHKEDFIALLKAVFREPSMAEVDKVLLVGGFGESKMILSYIKEAFPRIRVIRPNDGSLAIVKGAVIYAHNECIVKQRVARYTYCKRNAVPFDPKVHRKDKVQVFDKQQYVEILRPLITAGDMLPMDYEVEGGINTPGTEEQSEVTFPLYAFDGDGLVYLDDSGCIKLGEVTVPITEKKVPRKERRFNVKYRFGGTEIVALVTELKNGKVTEATFQFFG